MSQFPETQSPKTSPEEKQAMRRFALMSAVRIASLGILLLGIAIAQNAVEAPYSLGVVLAVGGMLGFFFGPYFMAKNWKSQEIDQDAGREE